MTPGARVAAAIEVLADIESRRRPVTDALKDWGLGHRFAGSKDRAAIASHVYDALRVRASAAWIMGAETPRAIMIGAISRSGLDNAGLSALFSGDGHAPAVLSAEEQERLAAADPLAAAPDFVRGDYPEWLAGSFSAAFGADAVAEGEALAARAPVDLRVNTLKTSRDKARAALAHLGALDTPLSPLGLRIQTGPLRGPSLAAEPAYAKGLVEVQDEGSQLAALLAAPEPRGQVLDLCAGGGGKTLALAAMLENAGQIYATDNDGRRLMPVFARLERAGARNVQVRAPKGRTEAGLGDLEGRCHVVLVDAPCTGTGAWRRNPDAKWRTRPGALEQRMREQDAILDRAVPYVRPGGRIVYVTCSVLREENEERFAAFLERHPAFLPLDAAHMARIADCAPLAAHASKHGAGLRLSPRTTGTDGFYIAAALRPVE